MADIITIERIVGKKEDLTPALAYTNANKAPLYQHKLKFLGLTTHQKEHKQL